MIVAVFGLPGSGKSYFARKLAEQLDATYISSDVIRRDLFSSPTYSDEEKKMVYRKMLATMYDYLHRRKPLVMDATFYTREIRNSFNQEAESIGCRIAWIEIRAEDSLSRARLNIKRAESDADYSVRLIIENKFQRMRREHLILESTNDNIDEMMERALNYLEDFKPVANIKN
jgi:predicted kinase